MKWSDRMKMAFYLGRLKSINKQMEKLTESAVNVSHKLNAIKVKYAGDLEIKCRHCKNEYYLEQVETKSLKGKAYWTCPGCTRVQYLKV